MRWWPRLVPLLCPAFYRVHACTTPIILHYTLRYGISVHVSMFSSALIRLITSTTNCELDGSIISKTVHLHCCKTFLFNYKALQHVYFVICLIFSSHYKLFNDTSHTCTYILVYFLLLSFSLLRHFCARFTIKFD